MAIYRLDDAMPSLNQEHFNELKLLVGEDFQELLNIYREDTTERLIRLASAIGADDSASVQELAHALKSASANLALERMAGWARQLEDMGRNDSLADAASALRELRIEFSEVEKLLAGK